MDISKTTVQLIRLERRSARLLITLLCATSAQKRTPEYEEYARQRKALQGQIRMLRAVINHHLTITP